MLRTFASGILAVAVIAQADIETPVARPTDNTEASTSCGICWDGSIAEEVDGGFCGCPPVPVEEPELEVVEAEPETPKCLESDFNACANRSGIFDSSDCTCFV